MNREDAASDFETSLEGDRDQKEALLEARSAFGDQAGLCWAEGIENRCTARCSATNGILIESPSSVMIILLLTII
jgi:hypothetical protein